MLSHTALIRSKSYWGALRQSKIGRWLLMAHW